MAETETNKRGINRWLVVLLLVAIGIAWAVIPPVRPVVMLAGEPLSENGIVLPVLGEIKLTNTLLTTIIVDAVLLIMAFAAGRRIGVLPAGGLAGFFEMILGALYDMTVTTAGKKWVRYIFPIISTIILLVLVSNLIKLVPGMETIGFIKEAHEHGYAKVDIAPGLSYITNEEVEVGEGHEGAHAYEVVPFFRSPSTDLNFTLALAISAVVLVEVIGFRANGAGYLGKFFNVSRFGRMWTARRLGPFDVIMPFIDIFVGVLELISEIARIVSFSFRLLGAMFGGSILVIVIGSLLPLAQFGVLFLELFFGVIQALVFGVLTLVFMAVATQSHGEHEGEHAHEEAVAVEA